ncbi:aspartyl/asparaginyl beta-hydroxylase domain-containing protein [bacterium]|nr:aspartyl/asparaginyl beta-hydroxylase domain-containing protein [bacterium]
MPDFPTNEILYEIQSLNTLFVVHREAELHKGWKSLCLHGLSAQKTMCYFDYGLKKEEASYSWTEIAEQCPKTFYYFKHLFPADSYERIRFMLVEPGGYVYPHRDREKNSLGPISIALNAPKKCRFVLENHGLIPLKPGGFYLIDLSHRHSVWNLSNENRYHITVECHHGSKFYKYISHLLFAYGKQHPFKKWLNQDYHSIKKMIKEKLAANQS